MSPQARYVRTIFPLVMIAVCSALYFRWLEPSESERAIEFPSAIAETPRDSQSTVDFAPMPDRKSSEFSPGESDASTPMRLFLADLPSDPEAADDSSDREPRQNTPSWPGLRGESAVGAPSPGTRFTPYPSTDLGTFPGLVELRGSAEDRPHDLARTGVATPVTHDGPFPTSNPHADSELKAGANTVERIPVQIAAPARSSVSGGWPMDHQGSQPVAPAGHFGTSSEELRSVLENSVDILPSRSAGYSPTTDYSPIDTRVRSISEQTLQMVIDHFEYGNSLARRSAVQLAKREFYQALATLSEAADQAAGTSQRTEAIRQGFLALEEANDFQASSEFRPVDLKIIVQKHTTPLIRQGYVETTSHAQARQAYLLYAKHRWQAAIMGQPLAGEIFYALGKLHLVSFEQGKKVDNLELSKAEALFETALFAQPEHPKANNELAVLMAKQGNWTMARQLLQQAVARDPGFLEAWQNLVKVHRQLGETGLALAADRQVQRLMENQDEDGGVRVVSNAEFAATESALSSNDDPRVPARPSSADRDTPAASAPLGPRPGQPSIQTAPTPFGASVPANGKTFSFRPPIEDHGVPRPLMGREPNARETGAPVSLRRPFGVSAANHTDSNSPASVAPFGAPPVRQASFQSRGSEHSNHSNHSNASVAAWDDVYFDRRDHGLPDRMVMGVDGVRQNPNREPRWRDERPVPWESLGYGEYIGPPRTPHLPEYRALISDQIDFVYRRTRQLSGEAYRFGIGDVVGISSADYEQFNDMEQTILIDGTIQVRGIGSVVAANKTVAELQDEINRLAQDPIRGTKVNPEILIKPINTETRLQDLIRTVDATLGFGGLSRTVTVAPDGTVQLPGLGSVPALGLSLEELSAEANARYAQEVTGLEVTAILNTRAPRFVYVLGEVVTPGQVNMEGPTTVIQAISQVQGWRPGANLRHVVVLRRDKNWQLVATRLDLSGPLWGHRPNPSDDLWLRHSDIVIVPKNAGQRLADFIEVYFSRGLYGVFPTQGFAVNFNGVSRL